MDLESPACSPRPGRWRLRDASPRRLLRQVEWGSLLSTVAICVALLIAQAILGGPRQRPFLTTDATISYPH